jgi:multicomponent K+:H+ antiporter subunit G
MIATVLEAAASIALVIGAAFALVGSLGLMRFDDVLSRLHGPTKATTLGVGGIAVGSMLFFAAIGKPTVHELLVIGFMFLTAPVSAHLIARAALHRQRREHHEARSTESSTTGDSTPETLDPGQSNPARPRPIRPMRNDDG